MYSSGKLQCREFSRWNNLLVCYLPTLLLDYLQYFMKYRVPSKMQMKNRAIY